ncbi:DUF4388 domain-containing protein [Chitinivibrio alkaliphilus]|nr:DUF4388 domain-containing protein [Chitinivibrio alkaliphilus]
MVLPVISGVAAGFILVRAIVWGAKTAIQRNKTTREEGRIRDTSFFLSGTIEEGRLREDIFHITDHEKTGVLHILIGRRKGYMLFFQGRVFDIFYREQKGRDALRLLLEQREGKYFFEVRPVRHPDLFQDDIKQLISLYNETTGKFQIT